MLGLVSLFTDSATEMIYPLIPIYVAALGSGAILLGVIEGVAETTAAMLKLVSGIISDKIGKRKLLVLIGYSISSFVRPFTGVVSFGWEIIFIRMADRVGKGIRTAPRDALIASSVDESIRGKSFGFHRAMDHTGAVIGPILAIITLLILFIVFRIKDYLLALRWTFILAVIPGVLAVLTIIFFIKEVQQKNKSPELFKFSLGSFDKNFKTYLVIITFFTLGNSSDAFLLYRAHEAMQKSGAAINVVNNIPLLRDMISNFGSIEDQARMINILFLPFIWAFFHIIKVIFSTPLGALSDKIGRKIVINIGWAIYAFVYVSFALLVFLPENSQIAATFVLFASYALFYAFTEGAEKAFVADIVKEEYRGSAFGMYNFAIGLGALPASVLFGLLYGLGDIKFPGFGGTFAFGAGGAIALISIILFSVMVSEPSKTKSGQNQYE